MLKLKSVTLKNFLSIGNVTQAVKMDDSGLTLVLGNNSDSNGGASRNGAGKTAILQALSFGLYGQPLTKIKVDNLINNINQRGMLVTVDFEFNGKDYRVERGRKPNILKFFVNGEQIEDVKDDSKGENRETQIDISGIIGMSHQMFTHVVGLNTYTTPFLKMRAAEQREVSEELLGVTQISQRAETLKKLYNETKEGIRQETANTKAVQEANSRILRAIEQAEAQHLRWETTHSEMVTDLARQIEELGDIDFEHEKAAFDQLDSWNAHQRDLVGKLSLWASQLTRVKSSISALVQREVALEKLVNQGDHTAVSRLMAERTRKATSLEESVLRTPAFEAKIAAKQAEIDNPGEHACVTCAQPLEGTDHLKTVMASLTKQLDRHKSDLIKHEATVEALRSDIDNIDLDITKAQTDAEQRRSAAVEEYEGVRSEHLALVAERDTIEKQISDAKDGMAQEDEKPDTLFENRDELYATKNLLDACKHELEREKVKENPHVQHLASLNATVQKVDFEEMERLEELGRHQDFLLKLLTNKDSFIRKRIIEQNLHYLNTRLNFYLDKLGLPHEVVFQNDLTVDITLLGRDYDFEQLSRGEMNRVIMSVSWSFRDVWESLNHSVNLVWIDELIDNGTDGEGSEAALAILKSFARNRKNVFLISHRDELVGRIDQTLLVSKQNGFTTIAEDMT